MSMYARSVNPREKLLAVVKEVAAQLGKPTISASEFCRQSGISSNQIYQHFDGFRDLCQQAGLEPNLHNVRLTDEQIFSAMRETFLELRGIVTRGKFDKHFRYSVDVFKKRGLKWTDALSAFRCWLAKNDPAFPYFDQLPIDTAPLSRATILNRTRTPSRMWQSKGGRQFGEPINFRGLLHAPVEEQDVVFLFGMVAHDLGYVVETVTTGFPDCEAKRRISERRWEKIRIEFEYQSRNFDTHGHDPNACDLIVCWEDNWSACPIEVLELRTAINDMDRKTADRD